MSTKQTALDYSLTEGSIGKKLLQVAVPVMGTQLLQMAYNLTDMFWLGYLDSEAIAASATVGMYLWLSMSLAMFGRMGGEIGVSQNLGRGDRKTAREYAQTAFGLAFALGLLYGLVLLIGRQPLVGFFKIQEANVVSDAELYLAIVSVGLPFSFTTFAVTGVFNGSGNAKTPFLINGVGLIINMILDPLFIFTFQWGIGGAAAATVLAQIVTGALAVYALRWGKKRPFDDLRLLYKPRWTHLRQIVWWSIPVATESFFFTYLAMICTTFVTAYGAGAQAAQRISSQIESLSWLISGGFASALTAFVGQNYGAGKWNRLHQGVRLSAITMAIWGVIVTVILYFGAEVLIGLFVHEEPEVQALGVLSLHILAACQLMGCLEGIAAGGFRGLGKTLPPSVASITVNALRVVAAYFLTRTPAGLAGIWWAISIGAIVRAAWVCLWYLRISRRLPREDQATVQAT